MYSTHYVLYPLSISEFSKTWSFSKFFVKLSIIIFLIRQMEAELFDVYGRMDGQPSRNLYSLFGNVRSAWYSSLCNLLQGVGSLLRSCHVFS
jgi:hypothetical protein